MADEAHFQALMNSAYDKYKDMSYDEFLMCLDAKERHAVLLGNMNYQIQNGGVRQWVDNGYACHAEDVLIVLKMMGTPRATEWRSKLKEFVEEHVDTSVRKSGFGHDYWLSDSPYSFSNSDDDYDDEDECCDEDELTTFYYSEPFAAEFMQEMCDFLSRDQSQVPTN